MTVPCLSRMDWGDGLFVAALLLIAIVTVIGNILVIWAVFSNRRLQNPANYLIANLAVSDFFQGALSMPVRTAEVLNTTDQSLIRCDIVISLTILFHSASNFNLALIALDRFIAISKPFCYANVVKTSSYKIVIAVTWLFCIILSGCIIVGWKKETSENENAGTICRYGRTLTDEYLIMYVCIVDVIPLIIMFITYTYIFRTTRRQISRIRAQEIAVNHAATNLAFDSRRESDANAWEYSRRNDIGTRRTSVPEASHANSTEKDNVNVVRDPPPKPEEETVEELTNNNNNSDELKSTEVAVLSQNTNNSSAQLSIKPQLNSVQPDISSTCESYNNNNNQNNQNGGVRKTRITSQNSNSSNPPLSTTRTRKATRTVLAIMGFFIVLCLPITIIDAIEVWCKCGKIPPPVITVALCMVSSNSSVNVFVYAGYNTDYRKAYWNIWRRVKQTFSNLFSRTKITVQSAQTVSNSFH